jgi:hypothetical protein
MPRHHGIALNQIYPQPGFQPRRDDKGGWTATQDYIILKQSWSNLTVRAKFSKGTSILVVDPTLEAFWSFLTITDISLNHEEGDHLRITVQYQGAFAQYSDGDLSDDAEPVYRLEGRLSEASVTQHPKFEALSEDERNALGRMIRGELIYRSDGEDGPGIYDPNFGGFKFDHDQVTSENGIKFRDFIMGGNSTYFFPTYTWTETTQGTNGLTAAQLNKLGKIATPRGNPPEAGGTRDWMLTSAFQEESGDLKQTALEWTMSDVGGWDDFLYDT